MIKNNNSNNNKKKQPKKSLSTQSNFPYRCDPGRASEISALFQAGSERERIKLSHCHDDAPEDFTRGAQIKLRNWIGLDQGERERERERERDREKMKKKKKLAILAPPAMNIN